HFQPVVREHPPSGDSPVRLGPSTLFPVPRTKDTGHRLAPGARGWLRVSWNREELLAQEFGPDGSSTPKSERKITLPSPPAVPPVEAAGVVVAALESGVLVRIDLADGQP